MSLSGLVAQQLSQLVDADERYGHARSVALEALSRAAGRGAPGWRREERHER